MPADEHDREQLTAAVERARRRVRLNQALGEGAWAGAIALLGPTLMLVAGRGWFAWPLLFLFAAAGAGLAAWRLWRRRPNAYQVSQALDVRLSTQDQISTAVYFLDAEGRPAAEQRRAAAGLAASAPLEDVFPVSAPRSLYALAAVALAATTLWALRYFLEKPLDLNRPLPQVIQQAIQGKPPARPKSDALRQEAAAKNKAATVPFENPETLVSAERQPGQDQAKPAAATPDPESPRQPDGSRPEDGATGDALSDASATDLDNMPIQSYEDMLERDAKNGLAKAEGRQGSDQDGKSNSKQPGDAEANSLLSKLREAMNNMLSRLQQKPQGNGKGQQQASNGSPSNGAEQQQNGRGEGQNGAGQPQPGGQQASDGEGAESDQQPNGAGAAAKAGAKGAEGGQKGSSGEGAGSQEGDKNVLEAQQAEAMGKLTELYGRRAQNVTGEVTVEAQPGKQTLRTPLSAKQGAHQDSGGQVSRDEIPLAYQAYIKEYFSKIRQADKK